MLECWLLDVFSILARKDKLRHHSLLRRATKNFCRSTTVDMKGSSGVSGVVGLGLGDSLHMASLRLIGVARVVPITCTYPMFNLTLTVFLMKESVTFPIIFGTVAIVRPHHSLQQYSE